MKALFFVAFLKLQLLISITLNLFAMSAIAGMITSLKNNKRERTSAYKNMKNVGGINGKLHFKKKASKRRLNEIKVKLQKENKEAFIKKVIFFTVLFSILIYFFAFHKY